MEPHRNINNPWKKHPKEQIDILCKNKSEYSIKSTPRVKPEL